MNVQSSFARTVVAIAAAFLMSTVAIGTAVGPAHAGATPVASSVLHV